MEIDGNTSVIPHLAYPSGHVRTPIYLNKLFAQKGRNAVLVPWQVRPEDLTWVVDSLRKSESVAGMVVTVPHKIDAAAECDELVGSAKFLNVVNVIKRTAEGRLIGEMFDGPGFVAGLTSNGHSVTDRKVLVLGAGGAATGVAHALIASGANYVGIANRSVEKAESLAARLNDYFDRKVAGAEKANGTGFDVVVNCTSLGMHRQDSLPIDPETLAPGTLVSDIIMKPDVTPLLQAAEAKGLQTVKGVHMILGQLALLDAFLLNDI